MNTLPTKLIATLPTKRKSRTKPNKHGLTGSQECFCRLVAENEKMTLVEAYTLAYPNAGGLRSTAMSCASRIWALEHIRNRVEVLRNAYVARCPLTKGEALTLLADTARVAGAAGDAKSLTSCIQRIQSLVPGWDATNTGDQPIERIEVTVITEKRERPVRDIDIEAIEVTDV